MEQRKTRIAAAAALASGLGLYSHSPLADHGSIGFGLGTAAPIVTSSAITLPAKKALVGVTTQYTDYNEFSNGRLIELNERLEGEARHAHSIESLLTTSLTAAYGVTDDITLGLRFPYVWRNNVREVPHHHGDEHHDEGGAGEEAPHVQNLGDPNGIGDTTVFGQWRFFNTEDNLTHVALLGSVKMPTGRTDRVTARSEDGEREIQGVHFQPGSGSWDGSLGLAFTQGLGNFSFDSNILYTWVTKGDRHVDLGDVFTYNAALSWSPGGTLGGGLQASSNFNLWTLMVELNGEWRDYQTERGVKDLDEGGHILYVSPGARFAGGENWNLALSFGVPIVTDLNGHQVEPDYRITSRINLAF